MKLDPKSHPWVSEPNIARIFAALPEGSTRFVGGCVRNALLGAPIQDIDLSTQLEPDEVVKALSAAKIKTVPTGIAHGTVTAIIKRTPYEITSLRRDVETDGRRAVVLFTKDWAEDAQRRDLTMNALYAGPDGTIFDPCGEGLDDITAKRFRFVGNADTRVREDYLRILRFFRFIAHYGGGAKIDAEALKACRENRAGLKTLSAERVWSEIKKILSAPNPVRALRIMLTNEILERILPDASNVEGLELYIRLETSAKLEVDPMRRLMALSARDEFAMAGLCKRMKMSKDEKTRLLGWAGNRAVIAPDMEERAKKQAVYEAGTQVISDRASIRAAGTDDPLLAGRWLTLASFAREWEIPEFPVKGRDLKAVGIDGGPQMGKMLGALRALWIKSGFTANKERLLMALALINR